MTKFVVEFEYNVDRAGRQGLHPAHAENLYRLADSGVLLLGGPLVGENAGILLYEAENRAELQRILDEEPYVTGGVVASIRIREWSPGKGSWVAALNGRTPELSGTGTGTGTGIGTGTGTGIGTGTGTGIGTGTGTERAS
ncbi:MULTISPECIES: YciI family protein [unclassified Streptomyces]|uniref:YciI family protein n=1 Tax=unclassified Streptomyces TaxID=2593676 RepID=UPI0022562481|nr:MULTISPECIES: YciI family protein [unclassified Streptomyces]MCX4988860.1 YciI family protein [Streptomyces sp. NBC_00568]MCX5005917.1 YciI family protein [Streptomyces sp. NBC_00638]